MLDFYVVKEGVKLFINDFADVILRVNGYDYIYESLSYTDETGWYLNLNNNFTYKVSTEIMGDRLLKFIIHKCGKANTKRIKEKNVREYKAYMQFIESFVEQENLMQYNPQIKIGSNSSNTRLVADVFLTSSTYIDIWYMYTNFRSHGNSRRLKDNYFFKNVAVTFHSKQVASNEN